MYCFWQKVGWSMCLFLVCMCTSHKTESYTVRLARVAQDVLYLHDIQNDYKYNHLQGVDSTIYLRKYVKDWVQQTLLYRHATEQLSDVLDLATIERKTLQYRKMLTIHALQQYHLNEGSEPAVSEDEIEAYYQNNISNFSLEHTLVKALYVKVTLKHPKRWPLRKALQSQGLSDLLSLESYCRELPSSCYIRDTLWTPLNRILELWPQRTAHTIEPQLSTQSFFDLKDSQYHYFLRIIDYRAAQRAAPLAYVREKIVRILYAQKRAQLLQALEDRIWEEAKAQRSFEIYF